MCELCISLGFSCCWFLSHLFFEFIFLRRSFSLFPRLPRVVSLWKGGGGGREGKGGRRDDVLVGRFVEKDLSSGVNIVGVGVWSSPAS